MKKMRLLKLRIQTLTGHLTPQMTFVTMQAVQTMFITECLHWGCLTVEIAISNEGKMATGLICYVKNKDEKWSGYIWL